MKIMQVLPRMNQGGVERGVVDIARYYRDREDAVFIVSGGGRLVKELSSLDVPHFKLNVFKKSLTAVFLIPLLRKIIIENQIDIVHARSRVPAWISFFATRGTGAHFLTTAHGKYSVHALSRVMGWGKFVICPSQLIARHMQDNFNVDSEKIVVINRWVDPDVFRYREGNKPPAAVTLMSVGRISPTKGYEYLIKAMRRIVRTNPYVNLHIVGAPDESKARYFNSLKSMVYRYSLGYNVKFLGYRDDVERLLEGASMLIMPSVIEESFGRVVIEAFASGVPVIATRLGGMRETITHRQDGILVPARDEAAISDAVLELLGNQELVKTLTANARKKVEQLFSLQGCISQTHEVYKRTISRKNILVVKISSLGDIILIIPALKTLKEYYPDSRITLLTLKKYASLFYDCPYVDSVMGLNEDYKRYSQVIKAASGLRRRGIDYAIDFQNSRVSQLICLLAFARKTFGFSRKLGFLYTSKTRFPSKERVDPLVSQERILRLLGVTFKERRLHFWNVRPVDIGHYGLEAGRYIGINISASAKWQTKDWPKTHIKRFVEILYRELPGYKAVFLGDVQSAGRAASIEHSLKNRVYNLCGKTNLRELIEVLKRCDAFITPDTATLHLAQSLSVPTIALFGPTDPRAHTVPAKNLHVMVSKNPCAPCYKWSCPTHECMKGIEPHDVLAEVKKLFAGR